MYLSRTLKGIRESRPPASPRKARPVLGAAQLRRIRMPVPRDSEQNKRLANDLALVLLAYAVLLRPSEIAYDHAYGRAHGPWRPDRAGAATGPRRRVPAAMHTATR